jgi:hypothetical protein
MSTGKILIFYQKFPVMKKILFVVLFSSFIACSKHNSSTPPTKVFFTGWSSANPSGQLPYSFDDNAAILTCAYTHPATVIAPGDYPGAYYLFTFGESYTPGNGYLAKVYTIIFPLPADSTHDNGFPLNQPMQFKYTPGYEANLMSQCRITLSSTEGYIAADSAILTVTITRYGNQTIDGQYILTVYQNASTYAQAENGVFLEIPVKK